MTSLRIMHAEAAVGFGGQERYRRDRDGMKK